MIDGNARHCTVQILPIPVFISVFRTVIQNLFIFYLFDFVRFEFFMYFCRFSSMGKFSALTKFFFGSYQKKS